MIEKFASACLLIPQFASGPSIEHGANFGIGTLVE
jgi:hypothetical protein